MKSMTVAPGPAGSGDPDRFAVHEGRIYIFATGNCRESFLASPGRYITSSAKPAGP